MNVTADGEQIATGTMTDVDVGEEQDASAGPVEDPANSTRHTQRNNFLTFLFSPESDLAVRGERVEPRLHRDPAGGGDAKTL